MGINSASQVCPKMDAVELIARQKLILPSETVTAAGAVSISTPVTYLVTSGAIAITLANGKEDQFKIIIMKTDGGTATLTPVNLANGTTIAFDDALDMWMGHFHAGTWTSVGTPTATVA